MSRYCNNCVFALTRAYGFAGDVIVYVFPVSCNTTSHEEEWATDSNSGA